MKKSKKSSFIQLVLMNWRELSRDKMNFFFTLVFPFMFILLFVLLSQMTGDSKAKIGIVMDANANKEVQQISEFIKTNELVDAELVDGTKVNQLVEEEEITIGLNFSADSYELIYLDENIDQAMIVRGFIMEIANPYKGPEILLTQMGDKQSDIDPLTYAFPGVLIMAFMSLALFGTAIPIIKMRRIGTLRLFSLTPINKLQFILSQVVTRLSLAIVQLVVIIGIGVAMDIVPTENILSIILVSVLGLCMLFSVGYLMGGLINSEEVANGISGGLLAPLLMLCGILFPLEYLPDSVVLIAKFIPLTYFGDAIKQLSMDATPVAPLGIDLLILLVTTIIIIFVAVRTFKWDQPTPQKNKFNKKKVRRGMNKYGTSSN
ncbi:MULTISPECIES: ABC transporter permease [Lysinibacillus]|uniref:ABC transporter permease n=1 Tax=Lysinibacillus TaxID=400634 RepID=UPI00237DA474|nr:MULTISPECIES: ABC transporter permease [Lysinibacillus]WDU79264.1 ABC transporter permease [Lysinibacillus sp. G01H]